MGMRKNVNRNSRLDSIDTNVDDDDLGSVNLNVEGKLTNLIHFTSYFIALPHFVLNVCTPLQVMANYLAHY